MQNSLILKVKTLHDLHSWEIGKQILRPIFSNEKLKPERAATFGEVTSKYGFDSNTLEDCKEDWGITGTLSYDGNKSEMFLGFDWKRNKSVKSKGSVTFPRTYSHGGRPPGGILFEAKFKKEIDWAGLFSIWCSVMLPYAALLHPAMNLEGPPPDPRDIRDYTFEEEIQQQAWSRFRNGTLYDKFRAGNLNSLVTGFTNLGWASFFGGEFAKEVDAAAISAAGFRVEAIGDGYGVFVTDDIDDVVVDFPTFSRRRAQLKTLFRDDLFLIKTELPLP